MLLTILWNTFFFIVALGVLVVVHEYGHFWVARRAGVQVRRFSVGFGKPLWRFYDRHGTEFVIAMIPLGGYVSMLDSREGAVPANRQSQDFSRKSVRARMAIASAGPIANFLLAILLYWVMFVYGVPTLKPVLGEVAHDSIAGQAGLIKQQEITAVDGQPVVSWDEVMFAIAQRVGETDTLTITVRDGNSALTFDKKLSLQDWKLDPKAPDVLMSLGLNPYRPKTPPVIGQLLNDAPAKAAGLQVGDVIDKVGGVPVADWEEVVSRVQANPKQRVELQVKRDGQLVILSVLLGEKTVNPDKKIGYLGAAAQPSGEWDALRVDIQYGLWDGFWKACDKTWDTIVLSARVVYKLLFGQLTWDNLSGPLSIAEGAGASAGYGLVAFLSFLALISINLGFVNLLPIPMLDGGHLLYYAIEGLRGRPLSLEAQQVGIRIGMVVIGALMLAALYNDLLRL